MLQMDVALRGRRSMSVEGISNHTGMHATVIVKVQLCPVVDERIPHLANDSSRTLSLKLYNSNK